MAAATGAAASMLFSFRSGVTNTPRGGDVDCTQGSENYAIEMDCWKLEVGKLCRVVRKTMREICGTVRKLCGGGVVGNWALFHLTRIQRTILQK